MPTLTGHQTASRLLQHWRGWLALCLGVPGLAAAEFRIDSLRLAPDGSIEIGYAGEVGSYFRLLGGETLDRVSTPVAITLGAAMRVPEGDQTGAQRFFLVEKLPVTSVVDTDVDGIPDVYELLRPTQLDPLNPTDAANDPDGDGQTFLQEYLASIAQTLTTISETSPAQGEDRVAVTRETIFYFSAPLAENTVLGTNHLSATFGGRRILSRMELSSDRRKATLFYLEPLPASARVQVGFDAAGISDANGRLLDADGDGTPGGVRRLSFDTLSITPVPGTAVIGRVFASELVPHPTDPTLSTNRPLAGVTITVDGAEQTLRTTTDENGIFRLDPAPAGRFFATVDGRTAVGSQWPNGDYYPVVGKAWEAAAGRSNNLAAGTGEIYLPLIKAGTLQPVSPTANTTITFAPEVLQANPGLAGVQITVPAGSLFNDAGVRGGRVGIAPVAPDRLPEPLPLGLNLSLVITIQTDGPSNFDRPVPVRFPNLPDPVTGQRLPPGAKTALWSFNHDTGVWEIQGSMTVTPDGDFAVTDPGVGVRQPGWHGTQPGSQGGGGPPPPPPPPAPCPAPPPNQEDGTACYTVKDGACLKALDSCLTQLLQKVCECYANPPRLNHGNDGSHTSNSRHYSNMAVDFSGVDFGDGDRYTTDESLAIAKCISGQDLTYDEDHDYYKASFTYNDCSFTILYESPDTDNSHIHIQRDDGGGTGTKDNPAPCDCPSTPTPTKARQGNPAKNGAADAPATPGVPPPPYFGRITLANGGVVLRFTTSPAGTFQSILPPDTQGVLALYCPSTREWWATEFFTAQNGGRTVLTEQTVAEWDRQFSLPGTPQYEEPQSAVGAAPWIHDGTADLDNDGLGELAENVLGTSPTSADSDGDGISDGIELEQGTNPLDGRPVATGIIASADTPGVSQDVAAFNDLAMVADGAAGITLFSVIEGLNPTRLAQVDTPGEGRRVAWSGDLAAVADGSAGLTILDVSDPSRASVVRQVQFGDNVISVAAAGPIAFVGLQQRGIAIVDMTSGVILDQETTGSPVHDLGLGGDYLFATLASALRSYRVTAGELEPVGNVPLSFFAEGITGSRRLFVGATHALVTSYPGYDAIDIRNPAALVRVGSARDAGPNSFKQIVENGSGLGVAAVGVNPRDDGTHDVYLYRTDDPTVTSAFLTALPTPGIARAVTLNNGLAYVADGDHGLEVVNYLAYDNQGVAPTIALTTSFPLTGPTNGVAEEGQLVRLTAQVTDDVQVRNVEFYVDGVRRFTDGNFPFEVRFLAPVRSATVTGFVVQARAIDTGGNSAVTPGVTVSLVPDATPPRVRRAVPAPGALIGQVTALQAFLSEPIDLRTLSGTSVRLVNLGADRLPGTSDDNPVTGYDLGFDTGVNLLSVRVPGGLAAGSYQLTVSAPLADNSGNVMAAPFVSTFRVFDFQDTDLDGVPDELETALGLDPFVADTDGDGLIDGLEDFDNDNLPNAGEVLLNRDPTVADSDNDGVKDGDEDSDGDSLSDGLEVRLGTDPLAADSDLDGWPDETEVTAGSNPLDPGSKPRLFLAAQPAVTLALATAVELSGLSPNTVAAGPPLTLVLPAATPVEGLAPNTVVARPPITLVLPAAAAQGLAPNTVFARPPLAMVLPAAGGTEGLAPNTVLARPPLTLTLPALDQDPEFLPNVTLGRPPLFIQIQNL